MEKKMHALTFCYEGYDDCSPYAVTIAVSEDVERLRAKMLECIAEDTREPNEDEDEDEYDDSINYEISKQSKDEVLLNHRELGDLYTSYKIQEVNVL